MANGLATKQELSLDEFTFEVRYALIRAGLPLESGMVPTLQDLMVFYADLWSVDRVVQAYQGAIKRYTAWLDRKRVEELNANRYLI